MLKNKSIIFFVKRYAMSNVYISIPESHDLIKNLSTQEYLLYTTIKGMVMEKPAATELKNKPLAERLGINERSVANAKASLKKKGYLIINLTKDSDGDHLAQVYLGKDQVALYQAGLKFEISDAKAYRDIAERFDILGSKTPEEREKMLVDIEKYYRTHYSK